MNDLQIIVVLADRGLDIHDAISLIKLKNKHPTRYQSQKDINRWVDIRLGLVKGPTGTDSNGIRRI